MSGPHDDSFDGARFPGEDQWLDLPLPSELDEAAFDDAAFDDAAFDDAAFDDAAQRAFTDRVLAAWRDERQLDEALLELDRELPTELLGQYAAPAPAPDFLASTLARLGTDRRQRWQELLARYVAPEPSMAFVNRTLAALRSDEDGEPHGARRRTRQRAHDGTPRARSLWLFVAASAAAALVLAWSFWSGGVFPGTGGERAPLELRLARALPAPSTYAESSTPLTALLVQVDRREPPNGLFDERADGLWLLADAEGGR